MGVPTHRIRPSSALVLVSTLALVVAGACELVALPSSPDETASPSMTATPRPTPLLTVPVPTPEPSFLIYQVRAGDALEAIAKRFRTTVDSIGYWNRGRYATLDPDSPLYQPDAIKVGWLLRIHPGETTDGEDLDQSPEPSSVEPPSGSPAEPGGSPAPSA